MTRADWLRPVLPAALGAAWILTGHGDRVLWLLPLLALLAFPPTGRWIEGQARRVAHPVSRAVSFVLLGLFEAVIVVPAWVWHTSFGRRSRRRATPTWQPVPVEPAAAGARPYIVERPSPGAGGRFRRSVRVTAQVLGVVVILLAVDYGLGRAYDAVRGYRQNPTVIGDRINITVDARKVTQSVPPDPRADGPAMAKYPWARAYFRELQLTRGGYYPYLLYRPIRFRGDYINVDDWERRSYEPTVSGSRRAPVVWFFGGSTTWGEGQRDGYTIPSQLARVAEQAGTPVIVRNFGERGWTNWQEMLLFEQLLSTRAEHPDFVVFYDGLNDYDAQLELPLGQPTHFAVEQVGAAFGQTEDRGTQHPSTGQLLTEVKDDYLLHSMVAKVVGKVQDWVDPPKPAPVPTAGVRAPAHTDMAKLERGVADVYQRGRRLATDLADHHGVRIVTFWQPIRNWQHDVPYLAISRQITAPTVQLLHEFDGRDDVYIDGGHTNEDGALLTARAQWATLQAQVAAWYRQHP